MASKPENNILRLKTPVEIEYLKSRKKKHSFCDDTKLKVDQVMKKMRKNYLSQYLFKNQLLLD